MSDLDDFFAKKDKNKKNKKKIFLSDNTKSDKSAERSKEKKFTNALGNLQKFIQVCIVVLVLCWFFKIEFRLG